MTNFRHPFVFQSKSLSVYLPPSRGLNHKPVTLKPISRNASAFSCLRFPDPPILAFSISLLFVVLRFSSLFLSVFLSFPRILGVPQREKPLLFFRGFPCFFQKSKGWRVRVIRAEKTMTATDVTGFDASFSTGFFATFSRF